MVTLNRNAVKPELLVYQNYSTAASSVATAMRTLIIGPNINTVRFDKSSERENGNVGDWYDSSTIKSYSWPNKTAGSLLKTGSSRVFITNAVLPYYTDVGSNFYIPKNSINLLRSTQVVSASSTFSQSAAFGSRGIKVGDVIEIVNSSKHFVSTVAKIQQQHGGVTITPVNTTVENAAYTYKTNYNLTEMGLSNLKLAFGPTEGTGATFVNSNNKYDRYIAMSAVATGDIPTLSIYDNDTMTDGTTLTADSTDTTYITYTDAASGIVFKLKKTDADAIVSGVYSAPSSGQDDGVTVCWHIVYDLNSYGAMTEIVLTDNFPSSFIDTSSNDTDVTGTKAFLIAPELEIEQTLNGQNQFSVSNANLTLSSRVKARKSLWFSDGGTDLLDVYSKRHFDTAEYVTNTAYNWGIIYAEYAEYLAESANTVYTLSSSSTVDSAIAGPLDAENPLKYGVYVALQESNSVGVNYIAVKNPEDIASWQTALDATTGSVDSYHIVPMSTEPRVYGAIAAFIANESNATVGHECVGFFSIGLNETKVVVSEDTSTDGNPVYARITTANGLASVQTAQNNYIYVPMANGDFIDNKVSAGDTVTLTHGSTVKTFTVNSVDNANALTIDEPGLASNDPLLAETFTLTVTHKLTKGEMVEDVVARKAAIVGANVQDRIRWIFPGAILLSNSERVSSMYAAAAVAGQASGVVFQQGLTRYSLKTIASTPDNVLLNRDALTLLSGNGIWVLDTDNNGSVYNFHAVTGYDYDTLIRREESLVRNADNVTKTLRSALANFVGVSNIAQSNITLLSTRIIAVLDGLRAKNYTEMLGGQITDYTTPSITVDPIYSDRLNVAVTVAIPAPLNNVYVTINFTTAI